MIAIKSGIRRRKQTFLRWFLFPRLDPVQVATVVTEYHVHGVNCLMQTAYVRRNRVRHSGNKTLLLSYCGLGRDWNDRLHSTMWATQSE